MEKYEIKDLINWQAVMAASRCAGGHSEVMESIFEDNARVCASWVAETHTNVAKLLADPSIVKARDNG